MTSRFPFATSSNPKLRSSASGRTSKSPQTLLANLSKLSQRLSCVSSRGLRFLHDPLKIRTTTLATAGSSVAPRTCLNCWPQLLQLTVRVTVSEPPMPMVISAQREIGLAYLKEALPR